MKTIFKKDDIVYCFRHGKGKVTEILDVYLQFNVKVQFTDTFAYFTNDGRFLTSETPILSFTPYDLVNGGFSQERPLKLASKEDIGKLVKCWDDEKTEVFYTKDKPFIGILSDYFPDGFTNLRYKLDVNSHNIYFKYAQVLTETEFNEINK